MDRTTTAGPAPARRRGPVRALLILLSILYGLAVLPAGLGALFSPMIADSGADAATLALIGVMITLPLALVVSPVLAWTAHGRGRGGAALVLILLPLLWLAAFVVFGTITGFI